MRARVWLWGSAAVLVMALLAGLGVAIHGTAAADAVSRCQHHRADAADRRALVTGQGRRIVVIGDSWSVGYPLPAPRSWPGRLPGEVHVDGFSGSGFSATASPCGAVSFAERASRAIAGGADLVLIEGGLNDFDQPEQSVRDGFAALTTVLAAYVDQGRVVVVGPAPAPLREAGARRVDGWLRELSAAAGVRYLSVIDEDLPYLRDRLHPTAAGHRSFGDWVAGQLTG